MASIAATAIGGRQSLGKKPMPTITTQYLTVPGGRLAFDDTGGPKPVVLAIPGMGDLRGEYRHLVPHLAAAGYRVVTLDIRGHGESDPRWDDYSAHAIGRDALRLIDHLDAGPAILMGTSFAAGSVIWAVHDEPEKVAAVVCFGPIVRELPITWYKTAALRVGFGGPWRNAFWMTYWDSLFPTAKPADQKEYRQALAANLRQPGRMDALRAMIGLSKADTEAVLGVVPRPTLVVMGTKDPDFPDPQAEARLVAGRMGGDVFMVEGAGHYPQAEIPGIVGPRVVDFLGKMK